MPISERTAHKMVLQSGATTLTLNREASVAVMQRKFLFWRLKPHMTRLSEITDITVDATIDRASGVEVCSTMLLMRSGAGWAFPASNKNDAQENAEAIRLFLEIGSAPES